jgi:hypothetical protein
MNDYFKNFQVQEKNKLKCVRYIEVEFRKSQ